MSSIAPRIDRRALIVGGLLTPMLPDLALAASGPLTFAVFRNGARIGEHRMTFSGPPGSVTATTEVEMRVKLGPVPVFRYRHTATERWADNRFASLSTATNSNGKREKVDAERTGGGVEIQTLKGRVNTAASTSPLTHWNTRAFAGPLFNPQTGKLLKVQIARAGARRWTVRGEAEIDDWYDESGAWAGLKGKLEDGSTVEYRRV